MRYIYFVCDLGEPPATTTEMPVTEVTYPSTTNESRLLTVYLSNKPTDFENETTLHNLKSSIAAMAEKYCSINNLVTNEDITLVIV